LPFLPQGGSSNEYARAPALAWYLRETESRNRHLEALLKWGSVAYALGFLTVTINTARLGIPTLELIEPVQVAVGIPVTIVLWLVLQAFKYFRRTARALPADIALIVAQYSSLEALVNDGKIREATRSLFEFTIRDTLAISVPFLKIAWTAPFVSLRFRVMYNRIADRLENSRPRGANAGENEQERTERDEAQFRRVLKRVSKFAGFAQAARLVFAFLNNVVLVGFVVGIVLYMYVWICLPESTAAMGRRRSDASHHGCLQGGNTLG